MVLYIICLSGLIILGSKFRNNNIALSRQQTTSIKGIFIVCVFLSHAKVYCNLIDSGLDHYYISFFSHLGQLMVSPFLLYSGYGIMESYTNKQDYKVYFLRNRIIKTLLHFDIALLLYVALNFVLSIKYPIKNYLLCWSGFENIGNSNWYIFDILVLYCISYVSMIITRKKMPYIFFFFSMGGVCFSIIVLHVIGRDTWWYDTLLCYPLGMIVSLVKSKGLTIRFLERHWYFLSLGAFLVVFLLLYKFGNTLAYSLSACAFCIVIILLSYKIEINSFVLRWFGDNLFYIYILQRIPMIVLSQFGIDQMPLLFTGASLVMTCILSILFGYVCKYVDKLILIKEGDKH